MDDSPRVVYDLRKGPKSNQSLSEIDNCCFDMFNMSQVEEKYIIGNWQELLGGSQESCTPQKSSESCDHNVEEMLRLIKVLQTATNLPSSGLSDQRPSTVPIFLFTLQFQLKWNNSFHFCNCTVDFTYTVHIK